MSDWLPFHRLDKTFINFLMTQLHNQAKFKVTTKYYLITGPTKKKILLEVYACLRRPHADHQDMVDYVKWKILPIIIISCTLFGVN